MLSGYKRSLSIASALLLLCVGLPTLAIAGAKIKVDDTRWFSIGLGFRSSFAVTEDGAPNGSDPSSGISFTNIRLYTAAKVHENVTLEFNTELSDGNSTASLNTDQSIRVLDAVAKFSFKGFDLWAGRFLPPSDRSNLDGPFYLNNYDFPIVQAYPAIFAGRDNGVAIMKEYAGGKFKWSYGLFEGRTNSTNANTNPDQADNLLHAARVTYNFWDPEPGYYTTSSYYGAKDVLAVAFVFQYEDDGAGTATDINTDTSVQTGDFTGWNVDVLMEKKLQNGGVVNLEGAYYDYDLDDKTDLSLTQGEGYLLLGSYLIPKQIGWGKFQPYVRYQHFARANLTTDLGNRTRTEGGVNYIIDGQNAKISVLYFSDRNGSNADPKNTFKIGLQFQL